MKTLVIAVFSTKGGCGKSVLAIHASVAATVSHRVLLVDADPQETVATWGAARTHSEPLVVRANPSNIQDIVKEATIEGFTLVVIDCPPLAVAGTAALLAAADHIVIPCQPAMPDLAATQRAVMLAAASGKPFTLVLNRAPARAAEVAQALLALAGAGDVSPIVIGDRRAFSRALTDSLAVTEFGPQQKASLEILSYWSWLNQYIQQKETEIWQNSKAA